MIPRLGHTVAQPKLLKSSNALSEQERRDLRASLDEALGPRVPFALTGQLDEAKISRGAALGLDESETTAIARYTSINYGEVNDHLRGLAPKVEAGVDNLCEQLDKGLGKLPKYHGRVFRAEGYFPAMDQWKPGEIIERKAPVSTSLNKSRAGDPSYDYSKIDGHVAYLAIDSVDGRDVSALSSYPGEHEVLFQAGQHFEIMSRTDVPHATFFVFRDIEDAKA